MRRGPVLRTPLARVAAPLRSVATGAPDQQPPVLSAPFLLAATANFLQSLSFNLYLHLPGFLHALGAGEVQIGVIASAGAAAAIAARPPIGRAMDARGRRVVILVGGVANVIVCLLYPSVDHIGAWLYLIRMAHGIAEAMLFAAIFTYATDLLPASRRTEGMALYGVSGLLPMSLGGLLGDVLLRRASYDVLFGVSAALAAASLLVSFALREGPPVAHDMPARRFLVSATQHDLLPVWFVGSVFATVLAANFTFLKTYVLATGIGSVGLYFTAYSATAILLRLFLARLPDRLGLKRTLYPALAVFAAGFVLLALARDETMIAAAGVFGGLGHGFTFPILSALVVGRARPSERGAAIAVYTALFDAGVLVGGPTLGAVIDTAGYTAMYASAAALLVAGTVVFAWWDRHAPAAVAG